MTITGEQAAKLLEGTTPGPWYRDAWDIRAPSPGTGAVCEVASPNGDDNQYWRDGESDANARLIAAAPVLAAALIASEAARKLAEDRLAEVKAALRVNMLRLDPTISHEAIDAFLKEIDNG